MKHYGVDHCRSIDLIINSCTGELNPNIKILKLYRETLGFAQVMCPLPVRNEKYDESCGKEFGSLVSLHYHLSSSHFSARLLEIFKKHSKEDYNAEKVNKLMSLASVVFNTSI